MVVGDADQSIYAFRGANIRNIMDFELDFPDASTILLEQNYRSTQTHLLTAANAVISRNDSRKPKNLWTDAGTGERIVGYVGDDEHDEARFVAEEIDRLTDEGAARSATSRCSTGPTRSRACSRRSSSASACPTRSSAASVLRAPRGPATRAYLRVLVNPADAVSLRRILNVPKRGIGDRAEACVESLAQRDRITFWEALQRAEDARASRPVR